MKKKQKIKPGKYTALSPLDTLEKQARIRREQEEKTKYFINKGWYIDDENFSQNNLSYYSPPSMPTNLTVSNNTVEEKPSVKTKEEKEDDLYDCPRQCGARMDWKDLQVHIQTGCEVTPNEGEVLGKFILAPLQSMGGTLFGTFVNPNPYDQIEIIIRKKTI